MLDFDYFFHQELNIWRIVARLKTDITVVRAINLTSSNLFYVVDRDKSTLERRKILTVTNANLIQPQLVALELGSLLFSHVNVYHFNNNELSGVW